MVEAIARQLDRCDVCGVKIHKHKLVRSNMDFLAAAGSNYLTYSSYSASGWTVDTATSAGVISIGPYADRARVSVSDSNTLTEVLGSQTWLGSGVLRSTAGVDASSWTSLVFAADVGPYQQETSPEITFTIGLCDSDGTNKEEYASRTTKGNLRVWFTVNIADLPAGKSASALYFYISATAVGKNWWADRLQVMKDVVKLGTFIPTSGSSVDRIDTPMMTVRKVCPDCREPVLSRSERYNRAAELRNEEPIALDIQEV